MHVALLLLAILPRLALVEEHPKDAAAVLVAVGEPINDHRHDAAEHVLYVEGVEPVILVNTSTLSKPAAQIINAGREGVLLPEPRQRRVVVRVDHARVNREVLGDVLVFWEAGLLTGKHARKHAEGGATHNGVGQVLLLPYGLKGVTNLSVCSGTEDILERTRGRGLTGDFSTGTNERLAQSLLQRLFWDGGCDRLKPGLSGCLCGWQSYLANVSHALCRVCPTAKACAYSASQASHQRALKRIPTLNGRRSRARCRTQGNARSGADAGNEVQGNGQDIEQVEGFLHPGVRVAGQLPAKGRGNPVQRCHFLTVHVDELVIAVAPVGAQVIGQRRGIPVH